MEFNTRPKFHQMDSAGVLFFGEIFHLTHDAFENWISALGIEYGEWFENPEWAVPLVHCEADFQKPMRAGNDFSVRPKMESLGESSFAMKWNFLFEGEPCAETKTVHVFIDKKNGRKINIPHEIREKLASVFSAD